MKKILFFVMVVYVLFLTGGATLCAISMVPKVGDIDVMDLIVPRPAVGEAALDYLQVLTELESGKNLEDVYRVACYVAE